jgi:hypothetical protein
MATFDLGEGLALKHEGMENAAPWPKECLAACREHLVNLAILRDDGCVTVDDAFDYIERKGLEPLGNGVVLAVAEAEYHVCQVSLASFVQVRSEHGGAMHCCCGFPLGAGDRQLQLRIVLFAAAQNAITPDLRSRKIPP